MSNTGTAENSNIYLSEINARRGNLIQSLKELENEIEQATDDVASAFREFQRFDLMRARSQEKIRRKMKRGEPSEVNKEI